MKTNTYTTSDVAADVQTNAAFFDLDNTLIGGDSDYLWGEHLARLGVVPEAEHRRQNAMFMDAYRRGTLNVDEFLAFQLDPLRRHPMRQLETWRATFLETAMAPMVLPKALDLLDHHRRLGDSLVIITSTNRFISEPIARMLGVDHLLATELEISGGRFTDACPVPPAQAKARSSTPGGGPIRTKRALREGLLLHRLDFGSSPDGGGGITRCRGSRRTPRVRSEAQRLEDHFASLIRTRAPATGGTCLKYNYAEHEL